MSLSSAETPGANAAGIGVLRCPTCARAWLVVGLKEGDRHICKSCGWEFAVTASLLSAGTGMPVRRRQTEAEDPGIAGIKR
jgi:hypothetical protein